MPDGAHRCKSCGHILLQDGEVMSEQLRRELYGPFEKTPNGISLPPAPLYERLSWYQWESADELNLVKAMVEHCTDGSILWASKRTLAAHTKLSKSWILILINGCDEEPGRKKRVGLLEHKILTQLAPADPKKNAPATYRLNEGALHLDPLMIPILERRAQLSIPGMRRPAVPGEAIVKIPASASRLDLRSEPTLLRPGTRREPGMAQVAAAQSIALRCLSPEDPSPRHEPAWCTSSPTLVHDVNEPGTRRETELNDLNDSVTPRLLASFNHPSSSPENDTTILSPCQVCAERKPTSPLSSTDSLRICNSCRSQLRAPVPVRQVPVPPSSETDYIAAARKCLLAQSCVRASWSRADAKTAAELFRSGVSLADLEHAIDLGCVRKYDQALNTGTLQPISSLNYFRGVIEEVREEPTRSIGPDYWRYIKHSLKKREEQWLARKMPAKGGEN
jgi:hypothetical protein